MDEIMEPLLQALQRVPSPALDSSERSAAKHVQELLSQRLESGDLDTLDQTWKQLYVKLRDFL